MGLALLVFPDTAPDHGSARALLLEISSNKSKLESYRVFFNPAVMSHTTQQYQGAQSLIQQLAKEAKSFKEQQQRHPRRTYKILFQDRPLSELWRDLGDNLLALLSTTSGVKSSNYDRATIWDRLDAVVVVCEDIEQILEHLISIEK